jgi:hypothetical protein
MIIIWPLGLGARWDKALSVPQGTALMFQQLDTVNLLDNTRSKRLFKIYPGKKFVNHRDVIPK